MKNEEGMDLVEVGVFVFLFAIGVALMMQYVHSLNKDVSVLASSINQDKNLYQQYDVAAEDNNTVTGTDIIGLIRNGSEYPITFNGSAIKEFGYLADISFISADTVYHYGYKINTNGKISELAFTN